MNICQVCEYTAPAKDSQGTQRVVEGLTKRLVELGHKVSLLINSDSKTSLAPVVNDIPVDTDIVHLHMVPQEFSRLHTFKFVSTIHGGGTDSQYQIDETSRYKEKLICVSKFVADRYKTNAYVHNFVDEDSLVFSAEKEDYFLWLAGTDWGENKGLFSSIALAKKLGFKLKIAGGGKNAVIIEEILRHCNNKIEYVGMVNGAAKAELIGKAVGLLHIGSIPDACSVTVVESLYSGTPIIVKNVGANAEVVGDCGIICKTDNDIIRAVFNIKKIDAKKCHDRYMTNFHSKLAAKKYVRYYENMIKFGDVRKNG